MVAPLRNTLAKSKQNHNAPSIIMTIPKEFVVGVTWWHPEEVPWLSRSRNIMPFPTIMTIQKKLGVWVAWWHPEEIPWLSRSWSILPLPTIMTIPKNGCTCGMVDPWRNTLDKSKQSKMGNWPFLFLGPFCGVLFLHPFLILGPWAKPLGGPDPDLY